MRVRKGTQLVVRPECTLCGASIEGSMLDRSIQKWETAHDCKTKPEKRPKS